MRTALLGVGVWLVAACGDDVELPPPREIVATATVDASGLSEEIAFEIPAASRSITIVVHGADDALYALGAIALGDGVDLVQLPPDPPGAAMRQSYDVEQIGQMPGGLFQSIRLGTFTHVYPYRPDQPVVAGDGRLRVASDRPGPVEVTIVMPEDDGATVLPLHIHVVSDTLADPATPAVAAELGRIFAQAGVTVAVDSVARITGSPLARITQSTEPQEAPASQSAMLPGLVAAGAARGLDVFVVEALPSGIGGLSLGTPGPPLRDSYYFGVIVRGGLPALDTARIIAHESAHFLALQHVQNRGVSGAIYPDPLDDTEPGFGNLMETGTVLTGDQSFALTRSALLVAP